MTAPTLRLTISIINYRTGDLTLNCVASVLADMASLPDLPSRIVVVDNMSGDGSAEQIEEWIASQSPPVPVDLVRATNNSGFSGGHNIGIQHAPAQYYLVLNSDAELVPGFLSHMLDAADAQPKAGLLTPKLVGEDGGTQISCFRFATPGSEFIRSARTGVITKALRRYDVSLGVDPDPSQIQWASFACIMLRHEMVAQIGPMDEGYFLYFEDAEYCLRAHRAGWGIGYVPQASAVHFRGGSGPVKSLASAGKRMPAYFYASRTRFLTQAHGRLGLWAANLAWVAGRSVAQLRRLAGKPVNPLSEAEARDIWINITQPLGPRRAPGE